MIKAVHPISIATPFEAVPLPVRTIMLLAMACIVGVLAGPAIAAEGQTETVELNGESLPAGELAGDPAGEGPATAYYRWIDGSGRIQYTDFEPVGVPAERISFDLEADEAPVLSAAAEARASDPFHDQDQQILPIEHIGPCADARRQLGILYAALPVYADASGEYRSAWRGDSYKGEREYLDAEARTDAVTEVRSAVLEHCSDPEAFAREEAAFQEKVDGS